MTELPQVFVTRERVLIRWPGDSPEELLTTVVRQSDGKPLLGYTPRLPGDAVELSRAPRKAMR